MPTYPRKRWKPHTPRGVKHCAVCDKGLPYLNQHLRWLDGYRIVLCYEHNRLTDTELWAHLQQRLSPKGDTEKDN